MRTNSRHAAARLAVICRECQSVPVILLAATALSFDPAAAAPGLPEWNKLLTFLVQFVPESGSESAGDEASQGTTGCETSDLLLSVPKNPEEQGTSQRVRDDDCRADGEPGDKASTAEADSKSLPKLIHAESSGLKRLASKPVESESGSPDGSIDSEGRRGSSPLPADAGKAAQHMPQSTIGAVVAEQGPPVGSMSVAAAENSEFAAPITDAVTEARSKLLKESGLLERQSEISESILLMERQIRQAQLVESLMELLGPDTPIEIAPGRFKVFRDTAAGQRIASEIAERQMQVQKRLINLEREIREAQAKFPRRANEPAKPETSLPKNGTGSMPSAVKQGIRVIEIYGSGGSLAAVVQLGDERVHVVSGSMLPNGVRVVEVLEGSVVAEHEGRRRKVRIGR